MKRIFTLIFFCFLLFNNNIILGQILTFEFAGIAGSEVSQPSNSNDPNLGGSTITRGTGLTASGNTDRFNATSWATTSIENAVTGNDYMEFTITPNSGYQFTISSIVVQWQRSATGNTAIALRSSVDGYVSNLDGIKNVVDNTSTQTFTWIFSQANSTIPVTYRFYSYAEATTGTGGPGDGTGNDIIVYGDVTPTSSPNDSDSEVDGPALSSQPDPMLISSLADSDPEAVRVFDFDVWDLGTSDGFPTKITQVTIKPGANNTANWLNTIAGAKLSINGGSTFVTTGSPVITASSIVFPITSGNLDIADNDAETVSLYIYLKNSGLIDNGILEFKVASSLHGFIADASGSQFAATIPGATSNDMLVDVIPSELRYVQQPSNTETNLAMSPAVTIQTTDVNGNRDLDFNSSISVTSTGTLTGSPVVVAAVNGLATFSTLTHTVPGTGFTLNAERDGTLDWDITSSTFNILEPSIYNPGDIVVNEYMANPFCETDPIGEYVELFNTTTSPIDINGWTISDDGTDIHTFNNANGTTVIPAGGYLVCGLNSSATCNPDYIYTNFNIGNSDDEIVLKNGVNQIFRLNYLNGDQFGEKYSCQLPQNYNYSLADDGTIAENEYIKPNTTFGCGDFGTPGAENILPISLMSFTVIKEDKSSYITWKTSSETNNSHFLIEWSRDAKEWNEIGTIKGSGTTHDAKEYSYIHENPKAGINYYRLTQVDFDGRKETFPAKSVFFESNQRNFDIIPNLAFNNVKIEFEKPVENGRLHIYNIDGQLIQTYVLASGIDVLRIDVSGLPAGQYIAKYIDGEDTINKKFIKQ